MLELNELLNEDAEDMLAHIRDAVSELLNIKHQAALSPDSKDNAAYQKALQKLEAEIRNRVTVNPTQIEHHLKICIDELNYKLEQLAKTSHRESKRSVDLDGLAQLETDEVLTQTTDLPVKSDTRRQTSEITKLRALHRRASVRILELEQKYKQAEIELKQVKDELEVKERDIAQKITDVRRVRLALTSRAKDSEDVLVNKLVKEISYYRGRFESKCLEVASLTAKLQLLNDKVRSSSKSQQEFKSTANSASPVRFDRSMPRKRSRGGLSGMLTESMSGTVKLKSRKNATMERSLSNEKLRKAYREVCRSRVSMPVTQRTSAK